MKTRLLWEINLLIGVMLIGCYYWVVSLYYDITFFLVIVLIAYTYGVIFLYIAVLIAIVSLD